MESALEKLVESPKLSLYVAQLQQILADERERREEFYRSITPEDKAEFINGEIVRDSPVRYVHNAATRRLLMLLSAYVSKHDLGVIGHEKLMVSLTRNDYEPDLCFFRAERAAQFTPDQWQFPAPDFVVEVLSESTEMKDRGDKMIDYAAHGVQEYWLVDSERKAVERYLLEGEQFRHAETISSGVLRSDVIPGFAVPLPAVFDEQENLKALQQILQD